MLPAKGTSRFTILPGIVVMIVCGGGGGFEPIGGGWITVVTCVGGNCSASRYGLVVPKKSPNIFGELYATPRPPWTPAIGDGSSGVGVTVCSAGVFVSAGGT